LPCTDKRGDERHTSTGGHHKDGPGVVGEHEIHREAEQTAHHAHHVGLDPSPRREHVRHQSNAQVHGEDHAEDVQAQAPVMKERSEGDPEQVQQELEAPRHDRHPNHRH
jgi:hypothetical protein